MVKRAAAGFHEKIRVYLPDSSIRRGFFAICADIFVELWNNRWLTYQLFRRDFSALYKQSFMGLMWVFVIPLFSVMTFVALNRAGIFQIGEVPAPYPVYAVIGVAFWQLFAAGLTAGTTSLVEAGQMIKVINFCKKSLVIAATGRAMIAFLIQMVLALLLMAFYGTVPRAEGLWVPLLILPILLLTWGLGFFFSLLNAVMRDVGNALSMLMSFLMFLTPILYMKPSQGFLSSASEWNPVYHLVSAPRDLLLTGRITDLEGFLCSCIFSGVLFLISLVVFHLTETRITERV